ncbi:hypothetical protein BVX95_02360 [archaeon D22]|nr:hypothetical protein BVX95_02360 [archaeon D22]
MGDKIHEEIQKAIDTLESKLKSQGFSDNDIEELKVDLEVGIKNNASMSDLLDILKNSEEKIQKKKGSKKSKSKSSNLLGGVDPSDNYSVDKLDTIDESVSDAEDLELEHNEEMRPILEDTVAKNSAYFSQGQTNGENEGIEYFSEVERGVYEGGAEPGYVAEEVNAQMQRQSDKEKDERQYKAGGKAKEFGSDPSSFYR